MVDTVPGLVAGGADLTGNTGTQLGGDSILDSPTAVRSTSASASTAWAGS